MPKRILIFSSTYHPFIGGAEIAVKEITDRIASSDFEFTMVTLRFDSTLPAMQKIGNVMIHRIGFGRPKPSMSDLVRFPLVLNKYLFPFLAYRTARQLHTAQKFDAIWSIMANFAGFAALFFKRAYPDTPFILTLQEGDPIEHIKQRVRFVYPWFEQIFKRADVLQAISQYLADFARSMGYQGRLAVIPNAVDVRRFSKKISSDAITTLRTNLGLATSDHCLITTSRLVPKNGIADVIHAIAQLPGTVHFLILGSGPEEQKLRSIALRLGVSSRVHFLGQINHEDIPKYLQASHIFIRPSLSEGMGNSFIEAMAARIPVIATPVGGIVDFLFDPEKNPDKEPTGILCGVNDPASIVVAVKLLLGDVTLRERITHNGYQLVTESYDWDLIAQKMFDHVFSKVC